MDHSKAPEVFNESHWSDPNFSNIGKYPKSKTLAELAAWKFYESLPKNDRFELSVVNPCSVYGPSLVKDPKSATAQSFLIWMNNLFPAGKTPKLTFAFVDVRDLVTAQIRCLERDAAQGKRIIIARDVPMWATDIN